MTARTFGFRHPRTGEEGGVLALVLILLVVLLAVAAIAIRGAVSDVSMAGLDRAGKTAFLCAESGIRVGVSQLAANPSSYDTTLGCLKNDGGVCPTACSGSEQCPLHWPSATNREFDVWLRDNVDETVGTNDLLHDKDQVVFVHARCTRSGLPQRDVEILYAVKAGGPHYCLQGGLCLGGNQNVK